jgi:hypothetical protein
LNLSESDQSQFAEQYARRAVDLLRQAQLAGYFDNPASVHRLKKDADLEPLRSRDDFVKLVAELEEKRKSAAHE